MPLITLCGPPSAGKTTLANEIVAYAAETYPDLDVVIINFESLKINRGISFANSMTEKRVNEMLRSAVERQLTLKRVVILDALNMVKGFRYELYTRAREVGTPHCVVHVDTPYEVAKARNEAQPENLQYSSKSFEDLYPRVEVPDVSRRWDNPLFTQTHGMPSIAKDVLEAMAGAKVSTVSFSTTPIRLEAPTFVRELDRLTQEVLRQIMTFQKTLPTPGSILQIYIPKDMFLQAQQSLVNTNESSLGLQSVTGDDSTTASHFDSVPTATSAGIVSSKYQTLASISRNSTQTEPQNDTKTPSTAGGSKIRRSGKVFGASKTTEKAIETTTVDSLLDDVSSLIVSSDTSVSVAPESSMEQYPFTFTRQVPLAELLTIRRNFTRISAMLALKSPQQTVKSFVEFLQVQIGTNSK